MPLKMPAMATKVARLMRPNQLVLYIGDWDFGGGHIEANNRCVLEECCGALRWERLALMEEQVKDLDLTVICKYDERDKKYHDAVETEALSQGKIIQILRGRLDELLPEPLADVQEREEAQREALEAYLVLG